MGAQNERLVDLPHATCRSEENMSEKIDFKKTLDGYQAPRGTFRIVDIPDMQYLMIDGNGDPNTSPAYTEALAALYPVAYKLKFASKRQLGRDYVVPPLEGLWWADDMSVFTVSRDKSQWQWTMMLMVPDWIDHNLFDQTVNTLRGKGAPALLDDVRYETLSEGSCVQTLHVGAFDDEGPILTEMHDTFMPEHELRLAGKHHEVYLNDARKVAPEKLRTILRQPVVRARKR